MTSVERHFSPSDVAELLQLEVSEVFELIDTGELPAVKISGKVRVSGSALEQLLEHRQEAQRRASLWQQSQTASIADLFGQRS
ncbi:helix-turn-helix domain-containing protein [uncultured Agrococcus sp.]|uniref:helix-turn-helix domain-containing protein n=1 Tax=uncultured Agrococcus sp. TaxID=382258 RepID=UPI0025D25769|nr:helix-turn-helix domain-containing protein [uncultured Agrococcus sp.]